MVQIGFFNVDLRLSVLPVKGDPLVKIKQVLPLDNFRGDIEAAVLTPPPDPDL